MKRVMLTLAWGSLAGMAAAVVGYSIFGARWLVTVAVTLGTVCYHMSARLIVGLVFVRCMTADCTNAWFQPRRWEKKLYRTLGVKRWKDRMPTFNPREFAMENRSLDEIIQATCQAELVHEVNIAISFVPIISAIWFGALPVFIITSLCGAMFDMLFVIMQRYNRPRLLRLMQRQEADTNNRKEREI